MDMGNAWYAHSAINLCIILYVIAVCLYLLYLRCTIFRLHIRRMIPPLSYLIIRCWSQPGSPPTSYSFLTALG